MRTFLKRGNYTFLIFFVLFASKAQAQLSPTLATAAQKEHALYVTDSIVNASDHRRDTSKNTFKWEPKTGGLEINGPKLPHKLSDASFYTSERLKEGMWWCVSKKVENEDDYLSIDSVVSYYDDMITIHFTSMDVLKIMVFNSDDELVGNLIVHIDPDISYLVLSAGTILSGSQTILRGRPAANIFASRPTGGVNSDSLEHYFRWQQTYDSTNFSNIENAITDSLLIQPVMTQLLASGHSYVGVRRRVIYGEDTAYTGAVFIYLIDSLRAGTISPATQSIVAGQIPQNIYGTQPTGGLCDHDYHYAWQISDNPTTEFKTLTDLTSDSLAFNSVMGQTKYYRRVDICGTDSSYSNVVAVNVTAAPPAAKPGVNTSITANTVTARKLPPVYPVNPVNALRLYTPNIPLQTDSVININATVEDVSVISYYTDSYGRTIQAVGKQTSPLKHDNVVANTFDEFGRSVVDYLLFTSSENTGDFKKDAFVQDSAFYKQQFPYEKIIYSQAFYDGSPFNIPTYSYAPGNSWGGSNRGITYHYRMNSITDSVRFWTIGTTGEDEMPENHRFYTAGSLQVQEVIDEAMNTAVKYIDELGRTVMTKTLLTSGVTAGQSVWLCTYYIYDEMNHLRMVIPPKAAEALKIGASANLTFTNHADINTNLCYSYYYDDLGRAIMKRTPGKGKSYFAYDLLDRIVMSQDEHLRLNNQWSFGLFDDQSRPIKSGVITTSLSKDSIIAQASRSLHYPILSGTYTVTNEIYYDNYDWIAATGAPVSATFDSSEITSTNFNINYNSAPEYAQRIRSSHRIRGVVTGVKKLVLNSSTYLYSVVFYDEHTRKIQTQKSNYSGGVDISTAQYGYNSRVLRTYIIHQKAGSNAQSHTVLTKYEYDHVGRIKKLYKNFDHLGEKTISANTYNELGKVTEKVFGNSLETQAYNYNIRGWILGINKDYVETGSSTSNYFGEILAYDSGFVNTQYNGNIAGVEWKAAGDRIARAYGFSYDKVNRLTAAEFYQQNTGSMNWANDKVDYSVSNLNYDQNGNILSMKQRGLLVGKSATIDSLSYQYFTNSNMLQKVTDGIGDMSPLGDFKDTATTGDDYAYDVNGNTVKDNNRHLHTSGGSNGAAFNILDKPDSIVIAGKSSTYYYYEAGGTLLRKQMNDYTSGSLVTKNYLYIGGFVYLNDTLQFALTEEGRIRNAQKRNSQTGATYFAYEYDYFIRDHQGNVRTVLTEGKDTATYQATMEVADSTREDALFANEYTQIRTIYSKPPGFDTDNDNQRVSRLNASTGVNHKTGPSLVLKVMAGDKVQISTYAFYNTPAQQPQNGVNLVSDILSILPGAITGSSGGKIIPGNQTALSAVLNPNVTDFLDNNRPYDNGRPKAYLNWIMFDEQFNYIASNSGVKQVESGTEKQALVAPLQTIAKNGFLYVYVSNESSQDVYFDDLTIKHNTGPLVQEQSYYPFGLQMAGISSKAALKMLSAYKYNGGVELEDEGGIDYYNTFYRKYDAQIGRFTGIDIKSEKSFQLSPYRFGCNNPILYNDPLGDFETIAEVFEAVRNHVTNGGSINDISVGGVSVDMILFGDGSSGGGGFSFNAIESTGDNSFDNTLAEFVALTGHAPPITAGMVRAFFEATWAPADGQGVWNGSGASNITATDAYLGFNLSYTANSSGKSYSNYFVSIGSVTESFNFILSQAQEKFSVLKGEHVSQDAPGLMDVASPALEMSDLALGGAELAMRNPVSERLVSLGTKAALGASSHLLAGANLINGIYKVQTGQMSAGHFVVNSIVTGVGIACPALLPITLLYGYLDAVVLDQFWGDNDPKPIRFD